MGALIINSGLGWLGVPLGPVGFPWVPFGSPWVPFGFPLAPLGFPSAPFWVGLGSLRVPFWGFRGGGPNY